MAPRELQPGDQPDGSYILDDSALDAPSEEELREGSSRRNKGGEQPDGSFLVSDPAPTDDQIRELYEKREPEKG